MLRLVACLWFGLAGAALASDWSYGSFDNGSWFEAHVAHRSGDVALHCGGRSPGGRSLPQTDEPMLTFPYALNLTLAQQGLGSGNVNSVTPPRTDVVVESGETGYRLPLSTFDELNMQGWITPINFGDTLVRALLSDAPLSIKLADRRLATYDTAGLEEALVLMIAFCDARWYAVGEALPDGAVAIVNDVRRQGVDIAATGTSRQPLGRIEEEAQRTDDGLWAAVQTYITQSCQGMGATFGDNYAYAANIDGDGVADYVIWWEEIECAGQFKRPFCGAAQCAVDVFISGIYAPGTRPKTVYAAAVNIVPGQAGLDVLQLAGRLATCNQPDAPADCYFLWGWENGDLRRLN